MTSGFLRTDIFSVIIFFCRTYIVSIFAGYMLINIDAIVELFDGGEGDDWYQIFITSSAPADGWNELYTDCLRQLNGEKPTKIKSRLKMAILAIDRVITEKKNKNIDKENISDEEKFTKLMIGYSFDDYTEKDWKDMALGLWHYGYFKDNIDYFATDIDLDLLNNIKKYL